MLRGEIWHPFFGDVSQSETNSEIKPHLIQGEDGLIFLFIFPCLLHEKQVEGGIIF